MKSDTTLTYQVYVAPIIAMAGKDRPAWPEPLNLEPDTGHPDLRPA